MTSRIFRNTALVTVVILVIFALMFVAVLDDYISDRVFRELEQECGFLARGVELAGEEYLTEAESQNRITWISKTGQVLYDNQADAAGMENHLQRQEISQAFEEGSGKSERHSNTLGRREYYCAVLLDDGTVMRISCSGITAATILGDLLDEIVILLLLALALSLFLASRLARHIMRPINNIDLDNPDRSRTFPELLPLLERIKTQNRMLSQQMDELSRHQREFTAITENMSEGFILIDNKANILSYNSSALNILSQPQPSEKKSVLLLNRSPQFRQAVDNALGGKRWECTIEINERCYRLIATPVSANGQATGAVMVILDITEQEQRDILRREFTANVSHELKTPLTSISGFAELMMNGLVPPENTAEFAGDIYAESRRLIAMVEDILRLSMLDEGAPQSSPTQVDLLELCRNVAKRLDSVAHNAEVTMTVEGEKSLITGVLPILDEMVFNLCDNAIKYNRPGGNVTVTVETVNGHPSITVADTGIGIPKASQNRVFERFYRDDKSRSKDISGTGLGLSIVKHAAQAHQATVQLKSQEGVGTEITIGF